ncbi:MAG: hypothetical protein HY078_02860 [Elusimicrobia bacterium]|nr:hypothetical protein [Elusimicrobiota bacterium]
MKYWLFQQNQVLGPYDGEEISQVKGFSAESLVCPEGRKGTEMGDWQRAGIVSELAECLLRSAGRVATATRPTESLLPPEPTLRDLAVLGSLQEKTTQLENTLNQLQEDIHTRDTELSRLKVELATKERSLHELQTKLAEVEGKVITLSGLKDDLGRDEKQIQELSQSLSDAKQELRRDIAKAEAASARSGEDEKRISDLAEKLSARDRQLEDLVAKLSDQEKRLDDLHLKVERGGGTGLSSMSSQSPTPASFDTQAPAPFEKPMPVDSGPSSASLTPMSLPNALGAAPAFSPAPAPMSAPTPAPEPMASPAFVPFEPIQEAPPPGPSFTPSFEPSSPSPMPMTPLQPMGAPPSAAEQAPQLPALEPLNNLSLTPLTPLGTPIQSGMGAPTPEPAAFAPTPFPSQSPSPTDSVDSPPLAFVPLSEPIMESKPASSVPIPGSALGPSGPLSKDEPPKMGKLGAKTVAVEEPEEMVAGKSLKKKGSKGGKFLFGAIAVALIAVGAGMMYMRTQQKPKKTPFAPSPELTPNAETAAKPPVDPKGELPPAPSANELGDPLSAAVTLAKSYVLPGPGNVTLQQRLEMIYPPQGGLSPWMVEKREGADKYQVNYYTNQNLVYEFLVRPQAKILQGINPPAVAVLNGEEPGAKKKGKSARTKRGGDETAAGKPAKAKKPAPAKQRPPIGELPKGEDAPNPAADEANIDELLLPGMSQPVAPKGGKKGAKAKKGSDEEGIPSAEELTTPADGEAGQ